jgi:hypothetical protein
MVSVYITESTYIAALCTFTWTSLCAGLHLPDIRHKGRLKMFLITQSQKNLGVIHPGVPSPTVPDFGVRMRTGVFKGDARNA